MRTFAELLTFEGYDIRTEDYETTTLADAGVDSLLLLQWVAVIEERTGRTVDDALIESIRTIGDLAYYYDTLNAHDA